jgi:5-formyltetrahydrofolate cyclo-ligase
VAIPDHSTAKNELRRTMRRLIAARTGDSTTPLHAVAAWLRRNPEHRVIATFHPITGEPDLTDLMRLHPERTWVFPRVLGDDLDFGIVAALPEDLKPGAFGIMEPADGCQRAALSEIDVFLCPGLAFDKQGGRLGRGKGYYDRALSNARPDAIKLGICFADQIVPDTFAEEHDIRMDEVLFEEVES